MIYNVAGLLSGELGESRQHEIENERLSFGESRPGGNGHRDGTGSRGSEGQYSGKSYRGGDGHQGSEAHEVSRDHRPGSFTQINGPVQMVRTDRTVLVTADIEAVTHATCSRCLEPATVNVSVALEEEFTPKNGELMGGQNARSRDGDDYPDPALFIDEQNYLDLREVLGQALTGATQIAPLCTPECLGICPNCTVNRNEFQCTCAQSSIDPRWEALAELVDEGAKSPS